MAFIALHSLHTKNVSIWGKPPFLYRSFKSPLSKLCEQYWTMKGRSHSSVLQLFYNQLYCTTNTPCRGKSRTCWCVAQKRATFWNAEKTQQTAFKDKIKNKKWKGSCEIHVILVGGLFICSLFVFPCPLGPPGGGFAPGCSSAAQVVFTVGSPPSGSTPPLTSRQRKCSGSAQKSPQNKCPTLFLFFYCLEGSFFIECWTKKNKMQEKKKNLPCLSL